MPRFYFDVQDGERCIRDQYGMDLLAVNHIWQVAVPMMDQIAKAKQYRHPPHTLSVVVRDISGLVVYRSDHAMKDSAPKADHDFEQSISNGLNARPREEPIGQTAGGLPDDTSKAVEITREEEDKIAGKILHG